MLQPENDRIEYKECLTDNLEREIVAFLNSKEGGELYIGIKDDGSVVGVKNCDKLQLTIKDRIKDNICPSVLGLYDIKCVKLDGKDVIKIIIATGSEKPYYLKSKGMSENGCFLRIGSAVQQMPHKMIDELYATRVRKSLSKIVSPRQKLTFAQLEIYYRAKGFEINDQFAYNLDLLTEDDKFNYVGFLCADKNSVSIKFGKYASLNKCELIENKEYGYCSIVKATEAILEKLNIENKNYTQITGGQRIDTPMIDARALREAVINAIVHNDYSYENPPVFEMYPDRLEITSNGGLGYFSTEEDFFKGRSNPKNRELMRIFKDLGYVEEMGSGIHRILEKYPRSVFEFSKNYITVVFPFAKPNEKKESSVESSVEINDTKLKILEMIKSKPSITAENMATNLNISKRAIEKNLSQMRTSGLIQRVGSTKSGHWEIIKK